MVSRCTKKGNKSYPDYGGRGIKVCDRWKNYLLFLEDMGEKPSPEMTLERKDNNKNYEPGNVVWATRTEQNNNTRRNRFITYDGKTLTLNQWSKETGIPYNRIQWRLNSGWTVADALKPELLYCGKSKGRKTI
jgi:hypothetical protein